MTKNPLIRALAATLYITGIASFIFYAPKFEGDPVTVVVPIAMLSLFTLSAAVMGYLFLSEPLQFLLEGKKKEAVNFFLKTVGSFAVITGLVFLALLWQTMK